MTQTVVRYNWNNLCKEFSGWQMVLAIFIVPMPHTKTGENRADLIETWMGGPELHSIYWLLHPVTGSLWGMCAGPLGICKAQIENLWSSPVLLFCEWGNTEFTFPGSLYDVVSWRTTSPFTSVSSGHTLAGQYISLNIPAMGCPGQGTITILCSDFIYI